MDISNVGKSSLYPVFFICIKELTLWGIPMDVDSVGKLSYIYAP
jgi:hypothetical protein